MLPMRADVSGATSPHAFRQVSDYVGRLSVCSLRRTDWSGLAEDATLTNCVVPLHLIPLPCEAMNFVREFQDMGIFKSKVRPSFCSICGQHSAAQCDCCLDGSGVCRHRQEASLSSAECITRRIVRSKDSVSEAELDGPKAKGENSRPVNSPKSVEGLNELEPAANAGRTDEGTGQVFAVPPRLEPNLAFIKSGSASFQEPVGIAAANLDGIFAVADLAADVIKLFSSQGGLIREISHYEKSNGKQASLLCPAGLAFDRRGNLVVVERGRHRVTVMTPQGKQLLGFGRRGKTDGQLWLPHGVSVDSHDRIIVTDTGNSRVQVFTSEGELLLVFGKTCPAHKLNYPCYTVYHEPYFYVSDTDNDCIKVFFSDGTFARCLSDADPSDDCLSAPSGLAVFEGEFLLVCDYNHDCVKVLTLDGYFVAKFGVSGTGIGQFSGPEALCVLPNGNVAVTDKRNRRVHSFSLVCNALKAMK